MENSKQKIPLKVFQMTQSNFATAGIDPGLINKSFPINGKIFMDFLIIGSAINCTLVYVSRDANTFPEYTQSIYFGSLATLIFLTLMIIIHKMEQLFKFIDSCECLVNEISASIFSETTQLEEKINRFVFFVIVKITPQCTFLPFIIHAFFTYFTTDLGNDAFVLPSPMW